MAPFVNRNEEPSTRLQTGRTVQFFSCPGRFLSPATANPSRVHRLELCNLPANLTAHLSRLE
jgi:hypothetical protein